MHIDNTKSRWPFIMLLARFNKKSMHDIVYKILMSQYMYTHVYTCTIELKLGLDKLCFFFCLLFFLPILKKSAYYSSLVYPLFQFKDVTFILKRQFICGCIVALQKVKYNPLVLSFAFEKKSFPKGKVHTCLVASAYTVQIYCD